MAVDLNQDWIVDLRQPILGDSFGWAGLEPTAAKKSLVFHHSASPDTQDGFDFANYHVNNNGWSGIGYHFVITSENYLGRVGFTNPGAQIQYVGDLGTWRAHVLNQNPGRVGICFAGFTPTEAQLKLGRQLVDFFIAPNNILPSINFYNQVTVHRLVPDQSTACPGDDYGNWLPYLQGGAEPWTPTVVPNPPLPTPGTVVLPDAGKGSIEVTQLPILRDGAYAIDYSNNQKVASIANGTLISVAQWVDANGIQIDETQATYARTKWSVDNSKTNGIPAGFFQAPTGQASAPVVPITVTPADQVASDVSDQDLQDATVPEHYNASILELIKDFIASLFAKFIKKGAK